MAHQQQSGLPQGGLSVSSGPTLDQASTAWALLNATLDAAFLFDRDGVILAANEHGARKMTGLSAGEIIGRSMGEFIPAQLFEVRLEGIREVFDTGQPLRFEDQRAGYILDNNLAPVFDSGGRVGQVAVYSRDITKQRQNEVQLRKRAFQQGVVAELGIYALANLGLADILDKTCRLSSTLFGAAFTEILEVNEDLTSLRLAAAHGFPRGMPGDLVIEIQGTQAGLALTSNSAVVVDDLEADRRIRNPEPLLGLGVKSGMSVVLHGKDKPFGVLGVHSVTARSFGEDEVTTLQSVANVLSEAVERFMTEKALEDLSQRNAAILSSVAQGIFGVDTLGRITFANRAVEVLTGFTPGEIQGENAHTLLHHTREDGKPYPLEECSMFLTLQDGRQRRVEEELYWRKDGSSFPADCTCAPLFVAGKLQGVVTIFDDVTERKNAQERLKRMAFFDELTGLGNRVQFKTRLEETLASRASGNRFAVLFLDLDDFKVINDGLGHTLGDRLLCSLAKRLQKILEPAGFWARIGGDEFAVLLDGPDCSQQAGVLAQRIHHEMALPERLDGLELFVSGSVGIVLDDGSYHSSEEVLRDADTAMFKAKTRGKGETAVFGQAMHEAVRQRLLLENDLRRALEREELFLAYQPIVDLHTGKPTGFEALLRWQHAERGLISPMEFIPVAEASGLILPIGEWVLVRACKQMAAWRALAPGVEDMSVSVNFSGRQFMQPDLTRRVSRILSESGLEPRAVKLEITESVVMENADRAAEMLEELRSQGLKVMIDDFGTGYSSLAYLRRFPVDTLKVDRSFVRNLDTDRDNLQIVKAVIQMAGSLELSVVAEGIETEKELAVLRALGCAYGQGYLFARPLGAEAAQQYLLHSLA